MNTPFLGGTYVSRSKNLAASRCVNLFLEMIETGQGKEPGGFYSTPGLDLVATIGPGPIRLIDAPPQNPTQAFVVSGNEVHVMSTSFVDLKKYGTIPTSSGPIRAVSNPLQYFFVDGVGGYLIDGNTQLLTQVLPGVPGFAPATVAYQDGFAVVSTFVPAATPLSQSWYQSNLNDFSQWQALNFSSADGQPDPLAALFDLHREVWLFGSQTIEVWINAGNPGFAFQRLQGVFIQVGVVAIYSIARVAQGVMWLSQDEEGQGMVMIASGGYQPQRVSTHAVETAISSYSRIDDAFAYCYQQNGHVFYVLTFPTGNATWCYDATEKMWHERAAFANGLFGRHVGNCFGFFNGQYLVGDYRNGNIYRLNLDTATDAGATRKWLRSWRALPPGKNTGQPMSFDSLAIDMETGIRVPAGVNPQMVLRFSDDSGNSWSNEIQQPMGLTGQTAARTMFTRLGSTSAGRGLDRVFELSSTDPVQVALIGASMEAQPA